MIKTIVQVSIAYFLLLGAQILGAGPHHSKAEETTMALGFVLIASYLMGTLCPKVKMPMITGYMLSGVFFGPYFLAFIDPSLAVLSHNAIHELELINHVALGLIAFTAGGELKLESIKTRWKALLSVTFIQSLAAFVGVGSLLYFFGSVLPGLSGFSETELMVASALLACTAMANSPSTTIAVINETQSEGPVTEIALGVTVIKDMLVIACFAATMSFSRAMMTPGQGLDLGFALDLGWEIVGSLIVGVVLGGLLSLYIGKIGAELPVLLMAVAFLADYLAEPFHLHGLLICMMAGFGVENFTPHGHTFIHAVERNSLPVYVIFFTLGGAQMELPALKVVGLVATILVVARAFFTWLGTSTAAKLSKESGNVVKYAWSGFLGQAGVTLGFAVLVSNEFPTIGNQLRTIIVAAIALNQVFGPVIMRFGLAAAGEIGERTEDDEDDLPVGEEVLV